MLSYTCILISLALCYIRLTVSRSLARSLSLALSRSLSLVCSNLSKPCSLTLTEAPLSLAHEEAPASERHAGAYLRVCCICVCVCVCLCARARTRICACVRIRVCLCLCMLTHPCVKRTRAYTHETYTYVPTAARNAQNRAHAAPAAPSRDARKAGGGVTTVTLSEQPFSFDNSPWSPARDAPRENRGGGEEGGRGGRASAGNLRRVVGGGGAGGRGGHDMGEGSPHAKLANLDPPDRESSPHMHPSSLATPTHL